MSKRLVFLSCVSFLALSACSGGGAGGEAKSGGAAKSGAEGGLALADISGTWYIAENMGGKMASANGCESAHKTVDLQPKQLTINLGQEEMVYDIGSTSPQGDALQIQATMSGSSEAGSRTVRYADATKKVLTWQEPSGELWRLERKETLAADGRFLKACCDGPEGEIGTEYAMVPESEACPPAPGK